MPEAPAAFPAAASARAPRTTRWALRPGWRAVRRGDGYLQVGIPPATATRIPDTPETRTLLLDLATGIDPGADPGPAAWEPEVTIALQRLSSAQLLVPADQLSAATRAGEARAHTASALYASTPDDAEERLRSRAEARWRVRGAEPWRSELARLLTRSGVEEGYGDGAEEGLQGVVHVSIGEPERATSDTLMAADLLHLWVALLPDRVRVGPFVRPGAAACLRCRDGHLAQNDSRLLLVLGQLEEASSPYPPPPVDAVHAALGLAYAAGDLLRFLDGGTPQTFSATVEFDGNDTTQQGQRMQRWERHPWCGCSWQHRARLV